MIATENMTINGKPFVRTYSDTGHFVVRDGVEYAEAIDPAEFGRTYTESENKIPDYAGDVTEADYQEALREMGVDV